MKRHHSWTAVLLVLSGCAASVASMYGVKQETDRFNDNQTRVTMTGGVIDADYLGIVSNAAEFNPFVLRSRENGVLATGIQFSMEAVGTENWLNLKQGSTATFLLNNGSAKVVLSAARGDIDYSVSRPQNIVYTTKVDSGVFQGTPDQLKQIAYATSVEVRVAGASSYIDFPRKPNNSVVGNFLPNLRKFYETEVQPYLK
jgi:hypothetical protein